MSRNRNTSGFRVKPRRQLQQRRKSILQLLEQDVSDLSELSDEDDETIRTINIGPELELYEDLEQAEIDDFYDTASKKSSPVRWTNGEFQPTKSSKCQQQNVILSLTATPIRSVLDYFYDYFNDNFFKLAAEFTNMYSVSTTGKSLNTNHIELKHFVGMNLMMGCIRYPRIKMYWKRSYACSAIAECMPRDRFLQLRNCFHVVDNN